MSNTDTAPVEQECGRQAAPGAVFQRLGGRRVQLNTRVVPGPDGAPVDALPVERFLPTRDRRMVGAFCFLDRYGPSDVSAADGMQVPPHPHTALQTVSWLLAGEIAHRDSVGSVQAVRPGQFNLMTAGRGISHSERSPDPRPALLHGVQLWTVLPAEAADVAPHFEHLPDPPVQVLDGAEVTVFMGRFDAVVAPGTTYSPLVAADVRIAVGGSPLLPLEAGFEHAVLVLDGEVVLDGERVGLDDLVYLGTGRSGVEITAERGARVLLFGGEPFEEQVVMWWNFIGRSHEDVVRARQQWQDAAERFGSVPGDPGERLPAPELPTTRLRPRGRER